MSTLPFELKQLLVVVVKDQEKECNQKDQEKEGDNALVMTMIIKAIRYVNHFYFPLVIITCIISIVMIQYFILFVLHVFYIYSSNALRMKLIKLII